MRVSDSRDAVTRSVMNTRSTSSRCAVVSQGNWSVNRRACRRARSTSAFHSRKPSSWARPRALSLSGFTVHLSVGSSGPEPPSLLLVPRGDDRGVPGTGGGFLQGADRRVVQVERRGLGTDPGQRDEVVPGRRAGGRPLQRTAVAPRVVDLDLLAVLGGLPDV